MAKFLLICHGNFSYIDMENLPILPRQFLTFNWQKVKDGKFYFLFAMAIFPIDMANLPIMP